MNTLIHLLDKLIAKKAMKNLYHKHILNRFRNINSNPGKAMPKPKIWPNKPLAVYISGNGSKNLSKKMDSLVFQAIDNKYNVFVYTLGCISSNKEVTLSSDIIPQNLAMQISDIHKSNGLVVLSFGGQDNTFSPGLNSKVAAKNTVDICKKYKFDGLDFDLTNICVDIDYLKNYIKQIRIDKSHLFITASFKIIGDDGHPISFAQNNLLTKRFLEAVKFDAFFIQS
ncbi:MAG: hypothetical protein JKX98_07295 [Alcanivoracaceae bacterium]|nr:hypothetical protein [Alcanivoracaceae bacterium]